MAEEVRNLAMRSAEAARNTTAVREESVNNARNGVDIAGEVAQVLDEIVRSTGNASDLVSEIAAASQEQAQGIDQVNGAVAQMDKITQQNAANAEESASASEQLSSRIDERPRPPTGEDRRRRHTTEGILATDQVRIGIAAFKRSVSPYRRDGVDLTRPCCAPVIRVDIGRKAGLASSDDRP